MAEFDWEQFTPKERLMTAGDDPVQVTEDGQIKLHREIQKDLPRTITVPRGVIERQAPGIAPSAPGGIALEPWKGKATPIPESGLKRTSQGDLKPIRPWDSPPAQTTIGVTETKEPEGEKGTTPSGSDDEVGATSNPAPSPLGTGNNGASDPVTLMAPTTRGPGVIVVGSIAAAVVLIVISIAAWGRK